MQRTQFIVAATVFMFAASAFSADNKCTLQKYAELPVMMSGTRPLISGTINGRPARFLADSGAFFSMLSRHSAAQYELKVGLPPGNLRVRGTGGDSQVGLAKIKDFTLAGYGGGQVINNVEFLVGGGTFGEDVAGIIGQNVLGDADSEYDLANGVIRVFRSKDCDTTMLAYWARNSAIAEMDIDRTSLRSPHLIGSAKLNGKKIRVMFDSGAWRSILTLDAAARAGITPDDDEVIAAGVSRGIGKRMTENSIARFDTLDLGGELIKNARLRIGDIKLNESDMLLGADFFLSHRIYVASTQHKIYFTYNGGPVFDLRENPGEKAPAPPTTTIASTTPPSLPQDPTMDAGSLRRRGAASAGRRDFTAALIDLDRAVELDGNDPDNFYQRALARWQNGNPMLAMTDFDTTLKLKPDHIDALLGRGALRLRSDNSAGARADFDEALKLAPADPSVGFRIAESYQGTGNFEAAIQQLDIWIKAYPKDERLASALGLRCWSRAMTGRELDAARADCDTALRKAKNSLLLSSRALVSLQLNDLDKSIADYKAALKLQPKHAPSLYGLGLAEIKKGLTESGNRNIQAALEINPTIATPYRRAGLTP